MRDGNDERFGGRGVLLAVGNVNTTIAHAICGRDARDQSGVDGALLELDGTDDKSVLGANAMLGVSLGIARAAAAASHQSLWQYLRPDGPRVLPMPMVNMISGGLHARGNLDFQDFLVMPIGARTYSQSLEIATDVYRAVGHILADQGYSTSRETRVALVPSFPEMSGHGGGRGRNRDRRLPSRRRRGNCSRRGSHTLL